MRRLREPTYRLQAGDVLVDPPWARPKRIERVYRPEETEDWPEPTEKWIVVFSGGGHIPTEKNTYWRIQR